MGQHGPIPARKQELLGHRSKEELAGDTVDRIRIATKVSIPNENRAWNDMAKRVYRSVKESAQTKFFEPSDWSLLYLACEEISAYYEAPKRSAMMLHEIMGILSSLMVSEADRRRLGIEIDRGVEENPIQKQAQDFYANLLGN